MANSLYIIKSHFCQSILAVCGTGVPLWLLIVYYVWSVVQCVLVWCRCRRLCILSSGYSTTLICCRVCSPKNFAETQSLYCPCLADNDNGSRGLFRTRKCNPPLLEEFNLILPNTSWHRSEKPLVAVLCLSVKDCSRFTYSCHFMKGKSCDLCYHFLVDSIRKQENSSWCYSTQEMSFNPRISVNKQVLK